MNINKRVPSIAKILGTAFLFAGAVIWVGLHIHDMAVSGTIDPSRLSSTLFISGGVLLILVCTALFFIYINLVKPVSDLVKFTTPGGIYFLGWGRQKKVTGSSEVAQLTKNLNLMSALLEKSVAYMDSVTIPYYGVDKEFTLKYVSPTALRLVGKRIEDVVEKTKCYDLFHLPECRTDRCPVARAWKEQKTVTGESDVRTDGGAFPVLYNASPMRDGATGEISRGFEVLIDITGIKKLSAEIEEEKHYLSRKVDEMLNVMEHFASGDLTVSLPAESDDAIGKLFDGFNRSVKNISEVIRRLNESIETAASAATQISSSTEELAAGVQEQAAQSAEVATAVEEMTKTVLENSNNAQQTAQTAGENGKLAEEGADIVTRTTEKMRKISRVVGDSASTVTKLGESSKEIGEIISVIDDIADQTNLLALNAAIEAARAGEQGKGFAVVADEVRKLAERTTQATKKIEEMIKAIQGETEAAVSSMKSGTAEVEDGIELADKAREAMSGIVDRTRLSVDMINQIAAASEEQSATSEQISRNTEAISSVASESANGVMQIAQAADSLNRLTENLRNLASSFKISEAAAREKSPSYFSN